MDPFHERLARVALVEAGAFGFTLAGGYAVQAHGFLKRFSSDIDLFAVADSLFRPYGMTPEDTSALRERMRAWARRVNTDP